MPGAALLPQHHPIISFQDVDDNTGLLYIE